MKTGQEKRESMESTIILASKSPRRCELLQSAGIRFTIIPADIPEDVRPGEDYRQFPVRIARDKARAVAKDYPEAWVLGADTIVVAGEEILGKPADVADGKRMLRLLSGKRHKVITGFALVQAASGREICDKACTEVEFKTLTDLEIDWYLRTGEPFDKAGAYAIQGIGAFFIRNISGSYTNVVGLPLCEVVQVLLELGLIEIWRHVAEMGAPQ
jgi:septum formation protein